MDKPESIEKEQFGVIICEANSVDCLQALGGATNECPRDVLGLEVPFSPGAQYRGRTHGQHHHPGVMVACVVRCRSAQFSSSHLASGRWPSFMRNFVVMLLTRSTTAWFLGPRPSTMRGVMLIKYHTGHVWTSERHGTICSGSLSASVSAI